MKGKSEWLYQSRIQNKTYYRGQRESSHNDKEVSPTRRYNPKYLLEIQSP